MNRINNNHLIRFNNDVRHVIFRHIYQRNHHRDTLEMTTDPEV